MTLIELKDFIKNGQVPENFIIFVCEENNTFLADQYVEEICRVKNCTSIAINSIYEPLVSSTALVLDYTSNICVLRVELFEEQAIDYSEFTNTIVICNKLDKRVKEAAADYIITMPKLLDWHIKDYMKQLCPALDENDIDWLYEATGGNIYRIINELDKISIFHQSIQKEVFNSLKHDPNTDLYTQTIFALSDALVKNDKLKLLDFLLLGKYCNFDPIAIVNMALNSYKKILLVNQNSGITAEDLEITPKQFNAIKYYYKGYTVDKLLKVIDFLSGIDLRLKSSEFDMSKERLLDYIICHVLAC